MSDEPTVRPTGHMDFDYVKTQAMLDERRAQLLAGNAHVWVVATVYVVDDPMRDPDDLALELENMVQIVPLHCLGCRIGFRPGLMDTTCTRITQGPF